MNDIEYPEHDTLTPSQMFPSFPPSIEGFHIHHHRYTITLIIVLGLTVLLLMNAYLQPVHLPLPHENLPFHAHGRLSSGNVEDQIKLSESYYQDSLKERQKLITKMGPLPSQIDAFPSHGEFYILCE